jgi:hypothetical protein
MISRILLTVAASIPLTACTASDMLRGRGEVMTELATTPASSISSSNSDDRATTSNSSDDDAPAASVVVPPPRHSNPIPLPVNPDEAS